MGDARASSAKTDTRFRFSAALLLICLSVLCFYQCSAALAAGGDGDGTGGGGGDSPVNLTGAYSTSINNNVSSTGASINGATNVPQQATIKLVFSVNVVDNTIWPSPNKNCITMRDGSGNSVPVNVFRIDPAVNREERDFLFLSPSSPLSAGTQYTIVVSPALTGKNGNTLGESTAGQSVSVSFTTQGTPASNTGSTSGASGSQNSGGSAAQNKSGHTGQQDDTTYEMKDNKSSAAATQTTKSDKDEEPDSSGGSSATPWVIALIAAVGLTVATGELYLRAKRNKSKGQKDSANNEDPQKGGG